MAILTPSQAEALKEPGCTYADRHFAITRHRDRVWTVTGLKDGAWPSFWKQTTSEFAAQHIVIRELLGQVEYLNTTTNRAMNEASALRTKLQARTDQIADALRGRAALVTERDGLRASNSRLLARSEIAERRLEQIKAALTEEVDD